MSEVEHVVETTNLSDILGITKQFFNVSHSKNSLVIRAPFQPALSALPVATNTGTPSRKRTVTVCSVVGTLYTDFKNDTVLFTVELRTTDRPGAWLARLAMIIFVY